jgi:serine/threonine-protein kinase
LDFGIAKAEHRRQTTRAGELKGTAAYMAPEQVQGASVDRRADVRAAGVVLWEALVGRPLFHAGNDAATMVRVLEGCSTPPSQVAQGIPLELDAIVMRALSTRPEDRFGTALEMAEALDRVFADDIARSHEIAAWLTSISADRLRQQWSVRARLLDPTATTAQVPNETPPPTVPPSVTSTKLVPLDAMKRQWAATEGHEMNRSSALRVPVNVQERARLAVYALVAILPLVLGALLVALVRNWAAL